MRINGASPDYVPPIGDQNGQMASKLAFLQAALAQKRSRGGDVSAELKLLSQARIALNRGDSSLAEQIASRAFASADVVQKASGATAAAKAAPARLSGGAEASPAGDDPAAEAESGDDGGGTYQDSSGDSGVSMKGPTRLSPGAAEYWVRAHEGEHVNREIARAIIDGKDVSNVAVRIYYRYSPQAKKMVPAGGTTFVTTKNRWHPPSNTGTSETPASPAEKTSAPFPEEARELRAAELPQAGLGRLIDFSA